MTHVVHHQVFLALLHNATPLVAAVQQHTEWNLPVLFHFITIYDSSGRQKEPGILVHEFINAALERFDL